MRDYAKLTDAELADAYDIGPTPDEAIYILNEIAVRADIDPDETEQGFTVKAYEQAFAFVRRHKTGGAPDDGYELTDPKHPTWRERMASLWDNREK